MGMRSHRGSGSVAGVEERAASRDAGVRAPGVEARAVFLRLVGECGRCRSGTGPTWGRSILLARGAPHSRGRAWRQKAQPAASLWQIRWFFPGRSQCGLFASQPEAARRAPSHPKSKH